MDSLLRGKLSQPVMLSGELTEGQEEYRGVWVRYFGSGVEESLDTYVYITTYMYLRVQLRS